MKEEHIRLAAMCGRRRSRPNSRAQAAVPYCLCSSGVMSREPPYNLIRRLPRGESLPSLTPQNGALQHSTSIASLQETTATVEGSTNIAQHGRKHLWKTPKARRQNLLSSGFLCHSPPCRMRAVSLRRSDESTRQNLGLSKFPLAARASRRLLTPHPPLPPPPE
jgi:hypothetical protein